MNSNKTIRSILIFSIVVFIYARLQKNTLPELYDISSDLFANPIQTETNIKPFEIKKGNFIYRIEPLYNYELYGLVVSTHDASQWWDYYHKSWNDFINTKDIGVIWGDNIKSEIYKHMIFTSGSWTLYYDFKTGTTHDLWSKFRTDCTSNNHLLPGDPQIGKIIKKVRKGDQIHLKGYLVKYSHSGSAFKRDTSTTRTDNGCETIFVTDFEILKRSNILWHATCKASKYSILLCLGLLLILFLKRPLNP